MTGAKNESGDNVVRQMYIAGAALALSPLMYFAISFVIDPFADLPASLGDPVGPLLGWILTAIGIGAVLAGIVILSKGLKPVGWRDGRWGIERDTLIESDPDDAADYLNRARKCFLIGAATIEYAPLMALVGYFIGCDPFRSRLLIFAPTLLIFAILPLVGKAKRIALAIEKQAPSASSGESG